MRLHVEALFTHDAAGRLIAVNEPGGGPAPRFFLGRTPEGNEWRIRHDLDAELARDLIGLAGADPPALDAGAMPEKTAHFLRRLDEAGPVIRTWMGPTYRFPEHLAVSDGVMRLTPNDTAALSPYLEAWADDVDGGVPATALLEDGKAVSICCSVRTSSRAHEAGVETHPDFRGRGYAARVVAGWAAAVLEKGSIPLFSTSWQNEASMTVARKLGLIQYGSTLHFM